MVANHWLNGMILQVGGGFKYFFMSQLAGLGVEWEKITPISGEMIQFDLRIFFQMGGGSTTN